MSKLDRKGLEAAWLKGGVALHEHAPDIGPFARAAIVQTVVEAAIPAYLDVTDNGWMPIETAPRDGTAFIGFFPSRAGYVADQRFHVLHWSGWGGGVWEDITGLGKYYHEITHWRPLPSPPKPEPQK